MRATRQATAPTTASLIPSLIRGGRGMPEPLSVGVRCGKCGSEDIYMLACPEHTWAVASICHGCQFTATNRNDGYLPDGTGENEYGEGRCPECGWPEEVQDAD